ncbi:MAG: transketolase C-terminal domain-containing protein [Propionibacteriaceae bacterium]
MSTKPQGPSSADALDGALRHALTELVRTPDQPAIDPAVLWPLFRAQAASRHLDLAARRLQPIGEAFYTIGSSGHESNAAVAAALRPTDPALLHYRSGGFYNARAQQVADSTPIRDVLQGLMGLADEPIAGGRHKVFGNHALGVIPQTSTIASHLPRAVGLAIALHRARKLGVERPWPDDAVVACSFGDASANHSTAVGAINTALNTAHRGLPVPILFLCEDNGLGISVPTPDGWIETAYGSRNGLKYFSADGDNVEEVLRVSAEAAEWARTRRCPVFLHLRTVRFLAHAGSDAEISYRRPRQIEADLVHDPVLATARALVDSGEATGADVLAGYDALREEVDAEIDTLRGSARLETAAQVVGPLSPRSPEGVSARAAELRRAADPVARTLAESINATLSDVLATDPRTLVFGEDVGVKGGVYGLTRGLAKTYGRARVFDTLLDEQSILGLALGSGLNGLVPIPEIQYLAYLHNAEDQLRGEAASLSFFSQGQYRNPMVVRIAGLAYQKGFGGHFHNDNGAAVLRDVPGLVVACPAHPGDAPALLRTCVAAAGIDGTVSAFLEPIALYHNRDLHSAGDGGWLSDDLGVDAPIGTGRVHRSGTDLSIITFGNGLPMSLRVAERLAAEDVNCTVLDLRWISPMPVEDIVTAASATGRVLVVDETRHSGGIGEGIVTGLVESGFTGPISRVSGTDTFIPLGAAANTVLVDEPTIEQAARALVGRHRI